MACYDYAAHYIIVIIMVLLRFTMYEYRVQYCDNVNKQEFSLPLKLQ